VCFVRILSESRMLEISTSGWMSGERKRVAVRSRYRAAPRLYSSHIFAVERHLVGPAILSPGLTSQGLRP
jgi:hypothetical protein